MGLETATYVGGLVATNPTAADPKSQGDDHLRLIKTTLLNTFAGFPGMIVVTGTEAQGATANDYTLTLSPAPAAYTSPMLASFKATHANTGAATLQIGALGTKPLIAVDGTALKSGDIENGGLVAVFYDGTSFFMISGNDRANRNGDTYSGTHDFSAASGVTLPAATSVGNVSATELSYLDGVTSAVQTQLDARSEKAGETYSGTHDFSGATAVTVPTPTAGAHAATKAYADGLAFSTALPSQTGNAGKYVTTDGMTASWEASGPPPLGYSARASDTQLVAADKATLIDITSGTFTQTFAAASTLGAGWWCYLRNSGAGDITLDPAGAETIDGLTSYIMYPSETRLVICTGSAFVTMVLTGYYRIFTASATWTKPPGYKAHEGLLWGGGGGGARHATYALGGGGGGACFPFMFASSALAASISFTIGSGGAAPGGSSSGSAGGDSTFSTVVAYGGGGCAFASSPGANGTGGGGGGALSVGAQSSWGASAVAQGGSPNTYGTSSSAYSLNNPGFGGGNSLSGNTGGNSFYGGGGGSVGASGDIGGKSVYGGGGGSGQHTTPGGTSVFGGAGATGYAGGSGNAGAATAPGGGGGSVSGGTGSPSAGARGELRIWGVL